MNKELRTYVRAQALITGAFNFFIAGMIAGLLHHQADGVTTDAVSIVIDILITCFLTFAITAPFARASLRRDNTGGVIPARSSITRLLARMSRHPALMCILTGISTAIFLSILTVSLFSLLSVNSVPFYLYVVLKSLFCMVLGAYVTCIVLYSGMLRLE